MNMQNLTNLSKHEKSIGNKDKVVALQLKDWPITLFIFSFLLLIASLTPEVHAEKALKSLQTEIPKLEKKWGNNPILIEAIRMQNTSKQTLQEIKSKDKIWIETSGVDEFMETLLTNNVAKELNKLEKIFSYTIESFAMDQQGALAGMTNKTSDYWQGDEEKFTQAFNNGNGAVYISEEKFDESAQEYIIQVSVPVMDNEKAIGAVTIGIDTSLLE